MCSVILTTTILASWVCVCVCVLFVLHSVIPLSRPAVPDQHPGNVAGQPHGGVRRGECDRRILLEEIPYEPVRQGAARVL